MELLLKVSFIISIIGLTGMYVMTNYSELEVTPVKFVTSNILGSHVNVCGKVNNKFISVNGHTFFDLNDGTGEINVVVFNSSEISFSKNDVCVLGVVDIYRNEVEIIAEVIND